MVMNSRAVQNVKMFLKSGASGRFSRRGHARAFSGLDSQRSEVSRYINLQGNTRDFCDVL
jgi:hypothetical protein